MLAWLNDIIFYFLNKKRFIQACLPERPEKLDYKILSEIVWNTQTVFFNNLWVKHYLQNNAFPPVKVSQEVLNFFTQLIYKKVDLNKQYSFLNNNDKMKKSLVWFILNLGMHVKSSVEHQNFERFILKNYKIFSENLLDNYVDRIGLFSNQNVLYWVRRIQNIQMAEKEKNILLQRITSKSDTGKIKKLL